MSQLSDIKATIASPQTKRLLPYIAATALGLVTIFMVYAAMVSPSKQPYRDAAAQYQAVYNANIAFTEAGAALGSSTVSDEQFTKNVDAAQGKLATLKTEAVALGKQAVLQEGEGKVLYDAFFAKLESYEKYNTNVLKSIRTLRPVLYDCNSRSANLSANAASVAALRGCVAKLEALKGITDDDYGTMLKSFTTNYADLAANIAAAAALKDPKGADKQRQSSLESDRGDILNSLNTATQTLAKDLHIHRAEVDITDTAKALDEYLSRQARLFGV